MSNIDKCLHYKLISNSVLMCHSVLSCHKSSMTLLTATYFFFFFTIAIGVSGTYYLLFVFIPPELSKYLTFLTWSLCTTSLETLCRKYLGCFWEACEKVPKLYWPSFEGPLIQSGASDMRCKENSSIQVYELSEWDAF